MMKRCDGGSINEPTDIEKRFVFAMESDPEAPHGLYDLNNPHDWPALRKRVRSTAHHEAGHYVARIFTWLELSHVVAISIIPNDGVIGRMTAERPYVLSNLALSPPPVQRAEGMMKLLEKLAGYGTQMLLDQSEQWESISDYWESNDGDARKGTDFFEAFRIAEIMAKPYMPAHRILKLADKWTLEMLRIPAVWNAIETVANILITKGNIKSKEISNLSDGLEVPPYLFIPKWRRRFSFTRSELDKYVERE
jgi:hypothetical protein